MVEIKNDLGLDVSNINAVKKHLMAQGITVSCRLACRGGEGGRCTACVQQRRARFDAALAQAQTGTL